VAPLAGSRGGWRIHLAVTWKSYNQNMGNDPKRDGTTATRHGPACGHPRVGAIDKTDITGPANDSYATRHNPFVYFRGVISHQHDRDAHVVTLKPLRTDLGTVATTPDYSWITPTPAPTATTRHAARTA
jgi:phosphatidylinositol-3-phosphatase